MKHKRSAPAMQFNRPSAAEKAKKAGSAKNRRKSVVRRPWTTPQVEELSKEEREIVLGRVQKEVAAPMRAAPAVKAHVVRGVNGVARALERGELGVVVVASNPESRLFGHIPLSCRLRGVPVCVLHLSSKSLGQLFGLKSLAVFGIRDPRPRSGNASPSVDQRAQDAQDAASIATPTPCPKGEARVDAADELSPADRSKLQSTIAFLRSKAGKTTTQ